ncbi:uncharacterized protein [Leptinotarsa decemlineata]|uniref:uncharacterized protein n=1 Tax=Leptinotarsa decemlineata TaxID=7539 RepID=UPI003D30AC9B
MISKSVAILSFLSIAYAATIQQKNIPVEIRYDDGVQITPKERREVAQEVDKEELAVKNLDAKVQLSPEELSESLKHLPIQEEVMEGGNHVGATEEVAEEVLAVKNLDAKVQLSPEELAESLKHLPVQEEVLAQETPEQPADEPQAKNPQLKGVPQDILEEGAKEVPHTQTDGRESAGDIGTKASTSSLESKLQHLRDIVVTELRALRESIQPKKGQLIPKPEQWDELEKSITRVYEEQINKLMAKQTQLPEPTGGEPGPAPTPGPSQPPAAPAGGPSTIFQNFINGVNGVMQNFMQNIQQAARPPAAQGDEGTGQPANPGGFVGFIQQGFTNIMNILTNGGQVQGGPSTSSTVLGDTGTPVQSSNPSGNPFTNFFGGVVNNVQNFLGIQSGGAPNTGAVPGVQGDTGVSPPNQQRPAAQIVNSIGNTINSFFQGRPPTSTSDSAASPPAGNGTGNIFSTIGNAIQNSPLNVFRPQNGGQTGSNPIQSGIQSAGNQIQQAVSGIQGQLGSLPGSSPAEGSSPAPPVVELPDGQRKPVAENSIQTKKPAKVENDNEIVQKVEQKEEILTTIE